jgi:DNA helicase-2/ATP-dependent DNA helicase PcrA
MFVDTPPCWSAGLNDAQLAAVEHTGAPLLIVAGAGTGKTATLAARVARLLDDGIPPDRILLLTFTRRAAQEMLARVGAMTDQRLAAQVWGGTFHSVAHRLLRHHGAAVGLHDGFTVLDQSDTTDLLGVIRTELRFGERARRFPRKDTIAAVYSRMVNTQAPLTEILQGAFPWCADHADDLAEVFTAYTARKRRHHVLDYDDLLLFLRAIAVSPASGPALAARFDHVLVDEYQDTNALQADIVAALVGTGGGVTVVGDDAQAIYGFRAATVANMWAFPARFDGAARVTLEQNHRSTTPILAVANALLRDAPGQFQKELWTDRPGGTRPSLTTCVDEHAQSQVVCDRVLELRERGVDLRDQAVLFRTGHHSDGLEVELARRDIPFVKYGGLSFLEAAHVKDLLALLRVVENPADQLAWHRVLGRLDGVGPATVRRVVDELGLETDPPGALVRFLEGAGRLPAPAQEAAEELRAAWTDCSSGRLSPAAEVDRLVPFCRLVFPARYRNAAARLADLDRLAASARGATSRSRLLADLTLDPPERTGDLAGRPHLDDDYLVLSTIHSAKGGEWRVVHLIHAADGNIPSEMALGDAEGLAEERRLAYVAVTRAREELHVTFPLRFHVHRHGLDDRHHLAQLSRFLEPHRALFDEHSSPVTTCDETDLELAAVTVADEVDALLHGLWARPE